MPHNRNDKFHHHVDYTTMTDEWIKIADLLAGEHDCLVAQKYLWLHSMEDPDRQCDDRDRKAALKDRSIREERTRYVNYARMVQERFVSLVMRGGLNPSEEVIELFGEEDVKNVDGQDNSLDEFTTKVCTDLVSYGVAYVMTDSQTIEARNILEEVEKGARPFWLKIHPLQFKDWQTGADGEHTDFRYEYMLLEQRATLEEEPVLVSYTTLASVNEGVYQLRTFAQKDVKTEQFVNHHPACAVEVVDENTFWSEETAVIIDELDRLPLATNRLDVGVLSPVIDIALKIYNKQSDLDNILHNQCYDRVFVFADLAAAITADGEFISDSAKEIKIATNSMVLAPEGGDVKKLEPTDPKALIESIRDDIEDLFRVAFNKARTRRVDSRAPESDRTQREIKEDLLTRIERVREKLLGIMNNALKDYAVFKNASDTDFKGVIEFAQSVTETDVEELSAFVRAHADRMDIYEDTSKAIDKKLISHLNLPKEDELFKEIDETTRPDPVEEAMKQMGNSQAGLQGLVTNNATSKQKDNKKVSKGNSSNKPKSK